MGELNRVGTKPKKELRKGGIRQKKELKRVGIKPKKELRKGGTRQKKERKRFGTKPKKGPRKDGTRLKKELKRVGTKPKKELRKGGTTLKKERKRVGTKPSPERLRATNHPEDPTSLDPLDEAPTVPSLLVSVEAESNFLLQWQLLTIAIDKNLHEFDWLN